MTATAQQAMSYETSAFVGEHRLPLMNTVFDIELDGFFAIVKTVRSFVNDLSHPIEATYTHPVPVDAVVTSLVVTVGGRTLKAISQPNKKARESYESGLAEGKFSVLHEELLKGIHMLSVGNLAPNAEVGVEIIWAKPLTFGMGEAGFRIPTTVASVYGTSPLIASDDLMTSDSHVQKGKVRVTCQDGNVEVNGFASKDLEVTLNDDLIISVSGMKKKTLFGKTSDGRKVSMNIDPPKSGDADIDVDIVIDISGSTGENFSKEFRKTVLDSMKESIIEVIKKKSRNEDKFHIWTFDDELKDLGSFKGKEAVAVVSRISTEHKGTRIGHALKGVLNSSNTKEVLLVTDGRSWDVNAQFIIEIGKRVSVLLFGKSSLDAVVGHIASSTGGQIVYVPDTRGLGVVETVFESLRTLKSDEKEDAYSFSRTISGADVSVVMTPSESDMTDVVGAYCTYLRLKYEKDEVATDIAVKNGLCTHLTSLVLVDDGGAIQEEMPVFSKIPLMSAAACPVGSSAGILRTRLASPVSMSVESFISRGSSDAGLGCLSDHGWDSDGSGHLGIFEKKVWNKKEDKPVDFAWKKTDSKKKRGNEDRMIDWGALSNRLATGDVDELPLWAKVEIADLVRSEKLIKIAKDKNVSPKLIAIGIFAKRYGESDRFAMRLSKRLLSGIDDDVLRAII